MAAKTKKKRSLEESRVFAVGHRVRIEILAILNEGPQSPSQLVKRLGLPLSTIGHHIEELVADRSIELARIESVRNTNEHFYRATKVPFYTDEEMWAMPFDVRQEIYGLIWQSAMAEALASYWTGKISTDPRTWMSWCWFNVDAQGRNAIANEQAESWERVRKIQEEATDRRAESGEEAVSVIVISMGFVRTRTSHTPPAMCQEETD